MADWENVRSFAAVAVAGSFSGAARTLGVEHATVARRVAALESETGLKLLDRRGRHLRLTDAGTRIAGIASRMEAEALALDRLTPDAGSGICGEVSISAPPVYAATILAPALVALRQMHPGVTPLVLGDHRHVSLDRREADIAIRLGRPSSGDLTIVKLGDLAFRLYASPDYLAATPSEDWAFIAYDDRMAAAPHQAALRASLRGRRIVAKANTSDMQQALARHGGGVAMLPDFMAAADPALVEAEPGKPPLTREAWIAMHSDMKDSPTIRAVFQHLKLWGDGSRRDGSTASVAAR